MSSLFQHVVTDFRRFLQVGMQNSTLGASLAIMHFADPLAATPCAVSACMHSVIGSLLAAYWQRKAPGDVAEADVKVMEQIESGTGA
jgi:bile acid:Na+ symporter, BASS family